MNYYLLAVGIGLSLINVYDFAYTTLSANGVGLVTGKLSRGLWKLFLLVCRHQGANRFFNHAGMITIVLNLSTWIILTWAAHSLIILSDPISIVNSRTQAPAAVIEKIYYTGDVLSTVGNGDFKAGSNFWRIYTVFIALSGLTILTIAITYLVQVLTAEISKRQLSIYIATLGGTPQSILLNGWNGKDFKKLERDFAGLSTMILAHSQNHLAYPILHHFHSSDIKESSCINLTALDEALTILKLCISEAAQPADLDVGSLRKSLTTYLITLQSDFISASDRPLPIPDLTVLQMEGIPIVSDPKRIEAGYKKLNPRRKLLNALMENDGWRWSDLNRPKFRSELDL
jgi:hypothetical protein